MGVEQVFYKKCLENRTFNCYNFSVHLIFGGSFRLSKMLILSFLTLSDDMALNTHDYNLEQFHHETKNIFCKCTVISLYLYICGLLVSPANSNSIMPFLHNLIDSHSKFI